MHIKDVTIFDITSSPTVQSNYIKVILFLKSSVTHKYATKMIEISPNPD